MKPGPQPRSVEERLLEQLDVSAGPDGCWVRLSAPDSRDYWYVGNELAHRVAFRVFRGAVPPRLRLNQTCGNRSCCNPDHIITRSAVDVLADAQAAAAAVTVSKEFCPMGHPYDLANTYWRKQGAGRTRGCKACMRQATREWRARKKSKDIVHVQQIVQNWS